MKMLRKTLCAMTLGAATLAPLMSTTVFAAPVAASEQQATANLVKQLGGAVFGLQLLFGFSVVAWPHDFGDS